MIWDREQSRVMLERSPVRHSNGDANLAVAITGLEFRRTV